MKISIERGGGEDTTGFYIAPHILLTYYRERYDNPLLIRNGREIGHTDGYDATVSANY